MTFDSQFSLPPTSTTLVSQQRFPTGNSDTGSGENSGSSQLVFGPENNLLLALLTGSRELNDLEPFPICIYGPSGTGKTELARWIAGRHFTESSLTHLSASDFYREYTDAIELDNIAAFRESWLSRDRVVIVDNLNELISKPRALDELSILIDRSCRLIVTCCENPAESADIPSRFSSRLLSGVSIPLSHPSADIRQVILVNELVRSNASIADDAARWLAEHVALTIPEIRQIISNLKIRVDFKNRITLSTVKTLFGNSDNETPKLSLIAKLVAKNQRVKLSELTGQSRKRLIVQARGIAVYIARENYQFKFEEIGRFFGNRDHSTIMHAHRKFQHVIQVDPGLASCVEEVALAIKQSLGQKISDQSLANQKVAVQKVPDV